MPDDSPTISGCGVLPALNPKKKQPGTPPRARAKPDRWGMFNHFTDSTLRELKPSTASVWIVLFRDTKPDGRVQTGHSDIARRTGLSESTVYRAISDLQKRGLLKVVKRGQLNVGPSVYRICAEPMKSTRHR